MKPTIHLAAAVLIGLAFNIAAAVAQTPNNQEDDESSRQIVLDRFNKARPLSEASAGIGNKPSSTAAKPPVYRRTGARNAGLRRGATTEEIGVTVWRLRPSRTNDEGGRVLVLDGAKPTQ